MVVVQSSAPSTLHAFFFYTHIQKRQSPSVSADRRQTDPRARGTTFPACISVDVYITLVSVKGKK